MNGQTLIDVLAKHVASHIEGMGQFFCSCDHATAVPWRQFTREAHALHLADAVAAWIEERLTGAREDIVRKVRDDVQIGPFGPNSLAVVSGGGSVSLTGTEVDDVVDAALESVREALGIEVRG